MLTVSIKVCCPILSGLNPGSYFIAINMTDCVGNIFKLSFKDIAIMLIYILISTYSLE